MLVYQAIADAQKLRAALRGFDPEPFNRLRELLIGASAARAALDRGAPPEQTWRELKRELYPLNALLTATGLTRIARRTGGLSNVPTTTVSLTVRVGSLAETMMATGQAVRELTALTRADSSDEAPPTPGGNRAYGEICHRRPGSSTSGSGRARVPARVDIRLARV